MRHFTNEASAYMMPADLRELVKNANSYVEFMATVGKKFDTISLAKKDFQKLTKYVEKLPMGLCWPMRFCCSGRRSGV